MKLKRFLLRYESPGAPPGVGLELDSSGELTVKHKNLPVASEVTTFKIIQQLVDEIISSEPDILTRRRHRPALLQLLGRLYQVDVEATEDEEQDSQTPSYLHEGQQVVLIKLSGKLQQHNGELGVLVKVQHEKGKYEVSVASGDHVKLKKDEHLVPTAAKGTPLAVGTHVAIRGLRNHVELNGCLGRVVECHEENHRYEVRAADGGQLFRVKQENLVPIDTALYPHISIPSQPTAVAQANQDQAQPASPAANASAAPTEGGEDMFEPGSVVQLMGLKTAMVYNGQSAEVLSADRSRSRYEIRLGDGSIKTIRAENVRLVSAPPKASPRRRQKAAAGQDA